MDSAIDALSGATGALAYPRVAIASVRLCASVKAVMVLRSLSRPETRSVRPSTNRR